MTPEQLKRRSEPFLPILYEQLDFMEREGAIIVVDRDKAIPILSGALFAMIDGVEQA